MSGFRVHCLSDWLGRGEEINKKSIWCQDLDIEKNKEQLRVQICSLGWTVGMWWLNLAFSTYGLQFSSVWFHRKVEFTFLGFIGGFWAMAYLEAISSLGLRWRGINFSRAFSIYFNIGCVGGWGMRVKICSCLQLTILKLHGLGSRSTS